MWHLVEVETLVLVLDLVSACVCASTLANASVPQAREDEPQAVAAGRQQGFLFLPLGSSECRTVMCNTLELSLCGTLVVAHSRCSALC